MKKKKSKDKKNIIITILALCVIASGLLNIYNEIKEDRELRSSFYSSSYLAIQDGDFNENFDLNYNSSYINVELSKEKKEVKVTPIKPGDTTLKINYITISGENKTLSYEISVRKGLSLEIDNK